MLALVFVDPLDQHVEDGVGVRDDAGTLECERRESALVVQFDRAPASAEFRVVGERFEPLQLRQILDPAVADVLADEAARASDC